LIEATQSLAAASLNTTRIAVRISTLTSLIAENKAARIAAMASNPTINDPVVLKCCADQCLP
jgi:hypothetical protein